MSVEEAILEKVRAMPPQKREEVLKFADSLRAEADADDAEECAVEEARQWLRENGGKGGGHEREDSGGPRVSQSRRDLHLYGRMAQRSLQADRGVELQPRFQLLEIFAERPGQNTVEEDFRRLGHRELASCGEEPPFQHMTKSRKVANRADFRRFGKRHLIGA